MFVNLGGEIINPSKNIPRSMFLSIAGIFLLYMCMNISIVSVIPWQEAKESQFVVSLFMEALAGPAAGHVVTGLILMVAFGLRILGNAGLQPDPLCRCKRRGFFPGICACSSDTTFPLCIVAGAGRDRFCL